MTRKSVDDRRRARCFYVGGAIRIGLAFGIVLGLTTSAGWGQTPTPPPSGWFRVTAQPPPGDVPSTIKGNVYNGSPYRVTDVRLQVEGIDGENHPVGELFAWAIGDIPAGGETFYVADTIPGAVAYRVTVVSYDLVSELRRPDRHTDMGIVSNVDVRAARPDR